MLFEIACEKFRRNSIIFHEGLNVVLGDDNATNSIGKSSFLMIVDFAYGGDSLIEHNKDIVAELGHHDYYITFLLDVSKTRFCRGTSRPELVYPCAEDGSLGDPISVNEYKAWLTIELKLKEHDATFRSLVSLFSRIWGKPNLDVHHPLHSVPAQSARECVDTLIKIFNLYKPIAELVRELKEIESEQSDLRRAFKRRIVPNIGKKKYAENSGLIEEMQAELSDIKANLASYALTIKSIVNKEVLELKTEKDELLALKLDVESKLRRVCGSLLENKFVRSSSFEGLKAFFPQVNADRLANIEEFHSSIAKILKGELNSSLQVLTAQASGLNERLSQIDEQLIERLGSLDSPSVVVDRVFGVSNMLRTAQQENAFFEKNKVLTGQNKEMGDQLSEKKLGTVKRIEDQLNRTMREIVSEIFGASRKSPHLNLLEYNYNFQVFEDTGTGTAYSSLIVLDLAVFKLTDLPFLIHDSILFKNVENAAVAQIVRIYGEIGKQVFIAIDEVDKYGSEAADFLRQRAVMQLSDKEVLFIKDWRRR